MSLIAEPTYEEFTNLFTNPNFLGDGTRVEVRRNLLLAPNPQTNWVFTASVTKTNVANGVELTTIAALGAAGIASVSSSYRASVTAAKRYSLGIYVENRGALPITLLAAQEFSGLTSNLGTSITLAPGEGQKLVVNNGLAPATATKLTATLRTNSLASGSKIYIREDVTIVQGPTVDDLFNGSIQSNPDPDLLPSCLGPINNSESILTGHRVRGMTAGAGAALIVSTSGGKPAARLVNSTGAATSIYATFAIPTGPVRTLGTWMATRNQTRVNDQATGGYNLMVSAPNKQTPPTNVIGSVVGRVVFSNLTGTYVAYLGSHANLSGGDVRWTDVGLFAGNYLGDAFSGETEELYYNNVRVFPEWVGEPNNSPSRFRYYTDHQFDVNPQITKWDEVGERRFETGVDRGMLYSSALAGVPWNGLTEIAEKPQGGDPTPYFIDGVKYLNWPVNEDFQATLKAYTYPREFEPHDGMSDGGRGLSIAHQPRKPFGLSYRTKVGNDIDGVDHGYKIHLVYNAIASPSERANLTLSDDPSAIDFSWALTTTPVRLIGKKASAHLVIDSTRTDPYLLRELEEIIYGTAEHPPRLPTGQEILDFFDDWITLLIIDHGDGTFTASGPDDVVYMTDSTMFEIDWASAVYISSDTYSLTSL